MTIDRDGNVGIGITNPSEKLDVNGDININGFLKRNSLNNGALLVDFPAGINGIVNQHCPIFMLDGYTNPTITSIGEITGIGFGHTSDSSITGLTGLPTVSNNDSGFGIYFAHYGTINSFISCGKYDSGNVPGSSFLMGKLGIGTNTPSEKLDVNGGININGFLKRNSLNNGALLVDFPAGINGIVNQHCPIFMLDGYTNPTNTSIGEITGIGFGHTSDSSITGLTGLPNVSNNDSGFGIYFAHYGTINSFISCGRYDSGNVPGSSFLMGKLGIGTNTPSAKLQVYQSTNNKWAGIFSVQSSTFVYLAYDGTLPHGVYINTGGTSSSGVYNLRCYGQAGELLSVKANGNVGIGTSAPESKLDVRGSIRGNYNTNTASSFGRATVGYCGHNNMAAFSHISCNTQYKYSLLQNSSGRTYLNCASGQHIEFRVNNSTKMILRSNANVGIGTTNPKARLHISGTGGQEYYGTRDTYTIYHAANTMHAHKDESFSNYHSYWSLLVDSLAWFKYHVYFSSDERIKEDISDISDNASLKLLRDISCVSYYYKDKLMKGSKQTIGFIAQQVNSVMPNAVNITKGIISNEMRLATDIIWNVVLYDNSDNIILERIYDDSGNDITKEKYKLTINDLSDNSGNTLYRFYVSNDISGNDECIKEISSLIDDPKSFIFEKIWNSIFIYGNEVNDFHTLDKNKLYALNFSATQEIDRIQQLEKTKLEEAQNKIISLENELTNVKSELEIIKKHLGL